MADTQCLMPPENAYERAKTFIHQNQDQLSRFVSHSVPVGAPRTRPFTRREELKIKLESGQILKRGGGRYKTKPDIPSLTNNEWRTMATSLQSELKAIWKKKLRFDRHFTRQDKTNQTTIDDLLSPAASAKTSTPCPEEKRAVTLIKEFREAIAKRPQDLDSCLPTSNEECNLATKAICPNLRVKQQSTRATKWITAGNKWPRHQLEYVEKCVREFERKRGFVSSNFFHPPDPCLLPTCSSEAFLICPVYVFDPFMRLKMHQSPQFLHCDCSLTRAGWSQGGPRRVFTESGPVFLIGAQYFCKSSSCSAKGRKGKSYHFRSYSDALLSQLPFHLQHSFPFVLTKKSGISKSLAQSLFWYKANGVGFSGVSKKLRERYSHDRDHAKAIYCGIAGSWQQHEMVQGCKARGRPVVKRLR